MNETEARDFIAKEVGRLLWMRLVRFAALFGVVNIVALIGLWYSVTIQAQLTATKHATVVAEEAARGAVNGASQTIKAITSIAEDQVMSLTQANGRLYQELGRNESKIKAIQDSHDVLNSTLKQLDSTVKSVTKDDANQFAEAAKAFADLQGDQKVSIVEIVQIAGKRLGALDTRVQVIDESLKQLDGRSELNEDGSGSLKVGEMLICWGRDVLKLDDNPNNHNSRHFSFTFAEQFDGEPTLANAILAKGTPHSFGVYNWRVDSNIYSGAVINHPQSERTRIPVTMEYIAVGRARK